MLVWLALAAPVTSTPRLAAGRSVTEVIGPAGDGAGNVLQRPTALALDASGNLYVVGNLSDNVFRIEPDGTITEIVDAIGDGAGNPLVNPRELAVDAAGIVYVSGRGSHNVLKVPPGGGIAQIIDASGDGGGNPLTLPWGVDVDAAGNVYVAGSASDNVFKITPGGTITQILDAAGDGAGSLLDDPRAIVVDGSGDVYVAGFASNNVFKVEPGGAITQLIDATGDGVHPLTAPTDLALDATGNLYVAEDAVFRIAAGGSITHLSLSFFSPQDLALGPDASVYWQTGGGPVQKRTPSGAVVDVVDSDAGQALGSNGGLVVAPDGAVYAGGRFSDNVLKVEFICDVAPRVGCRTPMLESESVLVMKWPAYSLPRQAKWTWSKGAATSVGDFGDPLASDGYALCIYDGIDAGARSILEATAPAGGTCASQPCWRATPTGFLYADAEKTPDGMRKLTLRAGGDGIAKVGTKAKSLALVSLLFGPLPLPATVQVQGTHGECWEARYFAGGVLENSQARFRGRAGSP